jgi:hypothetical protein
MSWFLPRRPCMRTGILRKLPSDVRKNTISFRLAYCPKGSEAALALTFSRLFESCENEMPCR